MLRASCECVSQACSVHIALVRAGCAHTLHARLALSQQEHSIPSAHMQEAVRRFPAKEQQALLTFSTLADLFQRMRALRKGHPRWVHKFSTAETWRGPQC